MTRGIWWLLAVLAATLAVAVILAGWWAGVAVGLPALLAGLLTARSLLADRPPPAPPVPADPRPSARLPADRVANALSWGTSSGRHFDRTTRPFLQRTLRAAAATRGLDPDVDRDQLRRLLGQRAWYLLDPARPARDDSHTGAVDRATLDHLVRKLEELSHDPPRTVGGPGGAADRRRAGRGRPGRRR